MEAWSMAKHVRIYICESKRSHGHSLVQEILQYLYQHGASGATVLRGVEGYGFDHHMHSENIEVLSYNLPILIDWVDSPEQVDQLLPKISTLVGDGLIVVDDVQVVKHASKVLRAIDGRRTVGEVMTREPASVHPETSVRELAELLIARNYRALPVVDADRRLMGIVTNGDLIERGELGLRAELLHLLEPEALSRELQQLERSDKRAADVMTGDVATVRAETDLASAAHLMAARRLKRLPVVDADNRLVGILSRVDVLRTATQHDGGVPEESLPRPTEAHVIADVMTPHAPAVRANAALPEVVEAVISTRLNRAVVVDDQMRPIGVITDAELLRRLDPTYHPSLARLLMRRLPFVRLSDEEQQELRFATGTRAADLMIAPAITVQGSTPVVDAARTMLERRYKILPVVGEEGRLIGLVDRADLLRAVTAS